MIRCEPLVLCTGSAVHRQCSAPSTPSTQGTGEQREMAAPALVSYRPASADEEVKEALVRRGVEFLCQPIAFYEAVRTVSVRTICELGKDGSRVDFEDDGKGYVKKLEAVDQTMIKEGERVWPDPAPVTEDLVGLLKDVRYDLARAVRAGGAGAGGCFTDDFAEKLASAQAGMTAESVKKRDVGAIFEKALKGGVVLPPVAALRPGEGGLSVFKGAFTPKARPGEAAADPTWPAFDAGSLKSEAGTVFWPGKQGSAAQAVATWTAYMNSALVMGHDCPLDVGTQAPLGPNEVGATPVGGWKLISAKDVLLSVASWQAIAANGGASGAEMIEGMGLAAVKIREMVGVQAGYKARLGPGAAVRAVAAEVGAVMAEAKQMAGAAGSGGKAEEVSGAGGRHAGETDEERKSRLARKAENDANYLRKWGAWPDGGGKGGGKGVWGAGGGKGGKGKGGGKGGKGVPVLCRDFQRGVCRLGNNCPRAHVQMPQAWASGFTGNNYYDNRGGPPLAGPGGYPAPPPVPLALMGPRPPAGPRPPM